MVFHLKDNPSYFLSITVDLGTFVWGQRVIYERGNLKVHRLSKEKNNLLFVGVETSFSSPFSLILCPITPGM